MAKESFVVVNDFKSPFVQITGMPHKPQVTKWKTFRKGEIINGEIKHHENKPAFVLVAGKLVVPLEAVNKVVTQPVSSNASGESDKEEKKSTIPAATTPKMRYLDAMILGGLAGLGGVYLAEKQGWLPVAEDTKKNKLIGTIVGILAGAYFVYRFKPQPKPKKSED